jgi:hypothetical protein
MDEKQTAQFSKNIQDSDSAAFCDDINARLYSIWEKNVPKWETREIAEPLGIPCPCFLNEKELAKIPPENVFWFLSINPSDVAGHNNPRWRDYVNQGRSKMIQKVHEYYTDFLRHENGAGGRYAARTPEAMGAAAWEEFRSTLKTKKQVNFSEALIDVADGCSCFHSDLLLFRSSDQAKVKKEFFDKRGFKSEYRGFFDIFERLQKKIPYKIIIAANAFVSEVLKEEYQDRLTLLGHKRIEIPNANGTKLVRPYSLCLLDKKIPLFLSVTLFCFRGIHVLGRQQLREDAHKVLSHLEKQQGLPNAKIIKEELSLEE